MPMNYGNRKRKKLFGWTEALGTRCSNNPLAIAYGLGTSIQLGAIAGSLDDCNT